MKVCQQQGLSRDETLYAQPTLPNQAALLTILFSQRASKTALPTNLGLDDFELAHLINRYLATGHAIPVPSSEAYWQNSTTRAELLELRKEEWQELVELLFEHAKGADISEKWLAKIVASACMGNGHLWRDLGLVDRPSLKQLFVDNFPELAARNSANMRWKKFLYRQLCEQGGHFVCRSPSCETCPTYDECFGDEE